jgi:tRNA threonylcarbamoyladenosine biosynthesis protein TsaB
VFEAAGRRREQPSLPLMEASKDMPAMLGIDTATADTAVAVTRGGELVDERRVGPTENGRPRHAATLLELVDEAVSAAGGWDAIGTLAVGVGPGTFTGLRVGVATARALAQARALAVAPVISLAALARGVEAPDERPRLALIDARRGEVFAGLYDSRSAVVWEPLVAPPEAIGERARELDVAPLAAGDGSIRFAQQLEAAGVEVLPADHPAHRIAARHVCALAGSVAQGRLEQARPIYLRRPDAELWRER